MSPISEARRRANEKYIKNNYDEIKTRVQKGDKVTIIAHAEKHDGSLNKFMNRAISETIQRDEVIIGYKGGLSMSLAQENRKYTYADYLSWPEDERIEIIDGVPYHAYGDQIIEGAPVMQAAPTTAHQSISFELSGQLRNFLKGKPCKAFTAPFAVRLNASDNDDTTLEPDIVVVCDNSKLDDRGCKGAPDVIMEILSPSTARKDRLIKYQKYQQAGVREYWIVDPDTRSIQACTLNDSGLYVVVAYADTDTAPVSVLPGCEINLQDVFAE